jgi:hypothetical protein
LNKENHMTTNSAKFGFKLREQGKRQAIAALRSRRWASPVIVAVFGISKKTAENLCYPNSGMYKAAFAEFAENPDAFIARYLTADLVKTLDKAAIAHSRKLQIQRLERAKQRAEDQLRALGE